MATGEFHANVVTSLFRPKDNDLACGGVLQDNHVIRAAVIGAQVGDPDGCAAEVESVISAKAGLAAHILCCRRKIWNLPACPPASPYG